MKRNYLLMIVASILMFGCNSNKTKTELVELKEDAPLSGKIIFSSDEIGDITNMIVKGDYIIFSDGHPSAKNYFYAINKHTGELVAIYGQRGHGPNEFLYPNVILNDNSYNDNKKLDIYDGQLKALFTLSVEDINDIKIISKTDMPAKLSFTNYMNKLGDNIVCKTIRPGGKELFRVVDCKNNNIVQSEGFFDCSVNINAMDSSYIYDAKLLARSDGDFIMAGMTFFDYVDLYDKDGLFKRYQFSKNPLPQTNSNGSIDKYIIYTLWGYCGNENYYILRGAYDITKKDELGGVTLIVFDNKGEYKKHYDLDRYFIRMCIDEQSGKLYGAITDDETGFVNVIEYQL
ncbi:MAG: hypothetical protein R3Y26_02145 [Rikenellaceae bacterium]